MANYPKQSYFKKEIWGKMISVFKAMRKTGIKEIDFPIDAQWNNYPVGEYLETLRQYRCEGKLTPLEMKECDRLKIKLQWFDSDRRWMYMYNQAKAFYDENGHCEIPRKKNNDLCDWVHYQKKCYCGISRKKDGAIYTYPPLTEEKKKLLEDIEIIWSPAHKWNQYYKLLVDFYNMFHHTSVPSGTVIGRYYLGNWVAKIRRNKDELSDEQINLLDEIHFNWKSLQDTGTSFWEQAVFWYFGIWYCDAKNREPVEDKDYESKKELDIYSRKGGIAFEYDGSHWHKDKIEKENEKDRLCKRLKIKLIRIREYGLSKTCYAKNYFLPKSFTAKDFDNLLFKIFRDELNISLIDIDTRRDGLEILKNYKRLEDTAFYRHLEELKEYIRRNHSFPPSNKKSHAGLLGWIYSLRRIYIGQAHGILTNEMIKALDEIGFVWNPSEYKLNNTYIHLKVYVEQGYDFLPSNYVDPVDNFQLGNKVSHLRQRGPLGKSYGGTSLTSEWINKFSKLGVNWTPGEPLLILKTCGPTYSELCLFDNVT